MEMLEMECHAKKIGLLSFRSRWFAIFQVKVTVRANVIFFKDLKKKRLFVSLYQYQYQLNF